MNKMIVTVFDNESAAYEGLRALNDLHRDGSITLYATAVVAKSAEGQVEVKQEEDEGPLGTVLGFAIGSLVGLLAGPTGLAAGAALGGLSGMLVDLNEAGVDVEFLDEVSAALSPGKVALLADADEMWMAPVDTRMSDLGGMVFRRLRSEVIDDQLAREAAAFQMELAELKSELAEASDETKAAIQKQIDNTKNKLEAINKTAKEKYDKTVAEGKAKIDALEKQIAEASDKRKAKMEKRKAEMRSPSSISKCNTFRF